MTLRSRRRFRRIANNYRHQSLLLPQDGLNFTYVCQRLNEVIAHKNVSLRMCDSRGGETPSFKERSIRDGAKQCRQTKRAGRSCGKSLPWLAGRCRGQARMRSGQSMVNLINRLTKEIDGDRRSIYAVWRRTASAHRQQIMGETSE